MGRTRRLVVGEGRPARSDTRVAIATRDRTDLRPDVVDHPLSYVGALVLTNRRLLGTLSTVPKKAGRAIDHEWSDDSGSMVTATLDASGLTLDVPDISVVDPSFAGSMSLHFKSALSEDVLARVPQRTLGYDVPPKFVYTACGVPRA